MLAFWTALVLQLLLLCALLTPGWTLPKPVFGFVLLGLAGLAWFLRWTLDVWTGDVRHGMVAAAAVVGLHLLLLPSRAWQWPGALPGPVAPTVVLLGVLWFLASASVVRWVWIRTRKPALSLSPTELREVLRDRVFGQMAIILMVTRFSFAATVFSEPSSHWSLHVWSIWGYVVNVGVLFAWRLGLKRAHALQVWGWCHTLQNVYLAWGSRGYKVSHFSFASTPC
jgi:hypothetical protein